MSMSLYIHAEKLDDGMWVHVPPPSSTGIEGHNHDWFNSRDYYPRFAVAVLTGVGDNDDNIKGVAALPYVPADLSFELCEIVKGECGVSPYVIRFCDLKNYDFDAKANMVSRTYPPAESGGKPQIDVQSHRWTAWRAEGYQETEVPVRELVPELLSLMSELESAVQTVPENIRLLIFVSW